MGNVHQFPNTMLARRAKQLSELFRNKGKAQQSTFEHLSIELEKLAHELRNKGQRSGAMQKAFGQDYSRMSGRFLARNGEAPKTVYRTPGAWLTVISGFAGQLDRDADELVVELLSSSPLLGREGETPAGDLVWLQALEDLLVPMTKSLIADINLGELFEYIALNGLYLEGDRLAVSEWPHGDGSVNPSLLYNPSFLKLVPHVMGVNYHPITTEHISLTPDGILEAIRELVPSGSISITDIAKGAFIEIEEGISTGLALAMRCSSRLIEPALIQWNLGQLRILDADHNQIIALFTDVESNLPEIFSSTPGQPSALHPDDCYKKPADWLTNSIRFHFSDSVEFERVATELIVRPWASGDPAVASIFWSPAHYASDPDEYPTRSPFFTTAGAIEGNLLYAELSEGIEGRLDTLLRRDIERIAKLVNDFRKKGDAIEQAARNRLLDQWGSEPEGGKQ